MAQVDFSNAVLAPYGTNPLRRTKASFDSYISAQKKCVDVNGNQITSSYNISTSHETNDSFDVEATGTFSTSGTEMYIYYFETHWRVSNISFNSGDTFVLNVHVELNIP